MLRLMVQDWVNLDLLEMMAMNLKQCSMVMQRDQDEQVYFALGLKTGATAYQEMAEEIQADDRRHW